VSNRDCDATALNCYTPRRLVSTPCDGSSIVSGRRSSPSVCHVGSELGLRFGRAGIAALVAGGADLVGGIGFEQA
jgi:hypothetical protein